MNVGVLTLVHGRRRLTRLLARYYTTLRTSHTLVPVAVASFTDEWATDAMPGWMVLYASNEWLTDKWQVGAQAMREIGVDFMLVVGSDDFADRAYIDEAVARDVPYIIPDGLHYYDTATRRCIYREHYRSGAGRVLRSDLLDDCDWRPWQSRSNTPDAAMNKMIEPRTGWPTHRKTCELGAVLDVKTEQNMWSFAHIAKSCRDHDPHDFLHRHFPTVAYDLLHWNRYKEQLY